MSHLIAIAFDDPHQADETRTKLMRLQRDYLVDLEDAVVAVRKENEKVKLRQMFSLTTSGAVGGGFWGTLIGLIFLHPLLGLGVGAAAGAVGGALADVGIDDDFMKRLAQRVKPGSSVLFVLVRQATPDKLLEHLQGEGGDIIHTSLSHEDEAKLQEALDGATVA